MKVLFITSNRLGDAVLSTGLLDYIVKNHENARVTVACGPLPTSIFAGVPGLERVISFKKKKNHKHWFDLWQQTRKTRWDMVVDLRNSAVSRVLPAKKRYIYGAHIDQSLHKVAQNAAVMGLDKVPSPKIRFTETQQKKAKDIIPAGGPVLAVGPTANWAGKTWPAENFIALIERLTGQGGILESARVAIFGAPGEESQAQSVLESIAKERCINVVGKADPGTAAAALARCALFIGNDSGLMHCAAAVGTPTVGLFGPSYPHLYGPWGDHCAYVRTPETFDELIDYEGYDPKTSGCLMTSLTLDAVLDEVQGFWAQQKKAAS